MLRQLRENTGNWIIKFFLGIIIIVFVFLGVGSLGSKRNNTAARINDQPISIKEFQQAYKNRLQQLQAQFGKNFNEDLIKAFNVKQLVLDSLVEQRLLLAQAEKLDIEVTNQELQDFLMSIKAFQKNGIFNINLYKRVLGRNSLNPEIFEKNQLNSMRLEKVRNLIRSTVNVSDQEVNEFYRYQNTKMSLNYFMVSPDGFKNIKPSEQQIKDYYEAHKDNYMYPAKRKAAYLKFSQQDYESEIKITDKAVKEYYEQNLDRFQTPERVEARHILIRLAPDADELTVAMAEKKAMEIYEKAKAGEDFQKLAKEFSEGPSKESGGYLGTFERKSMVKPFGDAAFAMKPGEISKPVKTQFGLHIIKLLAKFEAATQSLEQVSDKIRGQLKKESLNYAAYDKAGQAFDAVIDGDDFEQVAMIAGKKRTFTEAFDIDGNGLVFPNAKAFAQAAFELKPDEISDVKQIGGDYYLIQITETIEPAVIDYLTVKDEAKKDVIKTMQKEKALAQAKDLLAKAKSKQTLADLELPKGLTVKSTPLFTRTGGIESIPEASKLIEAGFTLDKPGKIYNDVIQTAKGYYVVSAARIQAPDIKDTGEGLKTVKNELLLKKQAQAYQEWLSELKQQNEITYNPDILN